MAQYFYKALKNNKTEVKGYIEAESPKEARDKIHKMGFLPTNIYEESFEKKAFPSNKASKIEYLSLSDKIFFTSELEVMISSEISIAEALETLENHAHKPKLIMLARDLKEKILSGSTFSEALKSYEKVFGGIYLGLCTAGEQSGQLDKTFKYLLTILRKQEDLKSRVINMSIYPAITVIILIAVFILCGKFIFPAFTNSAYLSPEEIPFMVNIVTGTCDIIFKYWMIIILLIAAGGFAVTKIWEQSSIKKHFDKQILKIPLVRDFVRYVNLSAFFTVLNVAYEAGLTIVSSIELSEETIKNTKIKTEAEKSRKLVTGGELLSEAFVKTEFLPPVFNTLILTGEKSGKLGQMFRDIALAIDKKLDIVTDALAKAFQPTLTVIIGLVVGYIVIAFFQLYTTAVGTMF